MDKRIVPVLLAALLLLTACGDGFPIGERVLHKIEVDGWMSDLWFSRNGEQLITIHRTMKRNTITQELSRQRDTIGVYQAESAEKIYEYRSEHRIWRAYTCADPDIIIYGEDNFPDDDDLELVFRSISSGQEIAKLWVQNLPDSHYDTDFHCDMEENLIYFNRSRCEIGIADGSTGELLRMIQHECIAGWSPLYVQKEHDRIIRLDDLMNTFYIFRLSSGELLGTVELWPNPYELQFDNQEWELPDGNMLFAINAKRDDIAGIYFMIVDLEQMAVINESILQNCVYPGDYALDPEGGRFLGSFNDIGMCLDTTGDDIGVFDYVSGEVVSQKDTSAHGQGPFVPILPLNLIYQEDWLAEGAPSATFYSYPDLEIVHQGKAPIDAEEHYYVSDGNLLIMESYFSDQFAVYDLDNFRTLDRFHLCDNVGANTLTIDPNQNWAAVMCGDTESEDADGNIGPPPEGAGVAIVGLDGYR